MEDLIAEIAESASSSVGVQDLWESLVVPLFPALTITNIRRWFSGDVPELRNMRGDHYVALYVLCHMGFRVWNDNIFATSLGDGLLCQTQVQGGYCKALADDPDAGFLEKRIANRRFVWSTSVGATTYGRNLVSQPVSLTKNNKNKRHPILFR